MHVTKLHVLSSTLVPHKHRRHQNLLSTMPLWFHAPPARLSPSPPCPRTGACSFPLTSTSTCTARGYCAPGKASCRKLPGTCSCSPCACCCPVAIPPDCCCCCCCKCCCCCCWVLRPRPVLPLASELLGPGPRPDSELSLSARQEMCKHVWGCVGVKQRPVHIVDGAAAAVAATPCCCCYCLNRGVGCAALQYMLMQVWCAHTSNAAGGLPQAMDVPGNSQCPAITCGPCAILGRPADKVHLELRQYSE